MRQCGSLHEPLAQQLGMLGVPRPDQLDIGLGKSTTMNSDLAQARHKVRPAAQAHHEVLKSTRVGLRPCVVIQARLAPLLLRPSRREILHGVEPQNVGECQARSVLDDPVDIKYV